MSGPPTYRRSRSLAWRRIVDETVVLHLRDRMAFGLNEPGARVLEALSEPRSLAWLRRLCGSEVDPRRVEAFLSDLVEHELVERCDDAPVEAPTEQHVLGERPQILWSELLPAVVAQGTLPMSPGDSQCL